MGYLKLNQPNKKTLKAKKNQNEGEKKWKEKKPDAYLKELPLI